MVHGQLGESEASMRLVRELRDRLEAVVRNHGVDICIGMPVEAVDLIYAISDLPIFRWNRRRWCVGEWRIAVLTAAIRAAIVTREAQP